jgi:ankyrin repeat protein
LEILIHGADASLVDSTGKTALHHLLSNPGYPDDVLIEFINREEVSPTLFQKDGEGYSPLHHALGTIRPAVCEALLAKGADLMEPDRQGRTALHYIASQCLLQERNHVDPWRWYHDLKDDFFDGCVSLWQKYLSQGGAINVVDNAGDTPLHAYLSILDPCEKRGVCHVDHYEALFPEDSGVDVFAVNKAGETALHRIASRPHSRYLVEGHDKALFVMMMDKGLDPLKEDVIGRSALDIASACDKEDIVGLLGRK